jgi:hypothetical protein
LAEHRHLFEGRLFPDEAFVCEERNDPEEAQKIADHYQRIISGINVENHTLSRSLWIFRATL